jgi:7,8-dihydropterin-6-yl-methyl-4-(beta-D-ribofuranosyl)aminobenzene 5'-phosphate synthase
MAPAVNPPFLLRWQGPFFGGTGRPDSVFFAEAGNPTVRSCLTQHWSHIIGTLENIRGRYEMEGAMDDLTITVVYDSESSRKGMEVGWGFSAVISGAQKTILFDTGRDASVLNNMQKLSIEPGSIDAVVLSHIHSDHTGGLDAFLEKNQRVVVYLPEVLPAEFKTRVAGYGARIVEVKGPLEICENVYSTGVLGSWMKEQGLVIRTAAGAILITGCAHPGEATMVAAAKRSGGEDLLLVMGGFHLEWSRGRKIEKLISHLKELGVRHVGPAHCSGDKARALFDRHFGQACIKIGAGKVIVVESLR